MGSSNTESTRGQGSDGREADRAAPSPGAAEHSSPHAPPPKPHRPAPQVGMGDVSGAPFVSIDISGEPRAEDVKVMRIGDGPVRCVDAKGGSGAAGAARRQASAPASSPVVPVTAVRQDPAV